MAENGLRKEIKMCNLWCRFLKRAKKCKERGNIKTKEVGKNKREIKMAGMSLHRGKLSRKRTKNEPRNEELQNKWLKVSLKLS